MSTTTNLGRVGMVLKGDYVSGTEYKRLDVVYDPTTKSAFVSKVDNNTSVLTDTDAWMPIADVSAAIQNADNAADAANAAAQHSVRFDEAQTLTDVQKAQARENIGAADPDGEYDNMIVGNAKQLVATVFEEDNAPYNFRTSGGNLDIGDRETDMLVGGTVAWNQIDDTSTYSTETINGVTWTKNADGTFTVNGTPTVGSGQSAKRLAYFNVRENHVYYVRGCPEGGSNSTYRFGSTEYGSGIFLRRSATSYVYNAYIFEGYTAVNLVFKPNVFDLTQMFGSTIADYVYGLETATPGAGVAWFRRLFPKSYYAYNAGTLMSVKTSAHKMVGFNAFDKNAAGVQTGKYVNANGELQTSAAFKASDYIPVVGGQAYHISEAFSLEGSEYHFWYNADKQPISGVKAFLPINAVAPANARYLRCSIGNSYFDEFCVNLRWDGERDGEYAPYEEHSYALDGDLELRGMPNIDANNNVYYDGDTYASDGTVTRKYGVLANQTGAVGGTIALTGAQSNLTDIITSAGHLADVGTISGTTLTLTKALSGATIVYALATPTSEEADPYQNPQIVDDFGTEEYVDTRDVAIPVGHETEYSANLRAKLEMAPNSPDGDGDYVVRQTNGINEYVELPTPVDQAGRRMVATVETAGTAAAAHAVGSYLIHSDTLYEVTAAIAVGDTLTVGTNIAAVPDGISGPVAKLKSAITDILDHETYNEGIVTEYDPVTANSTVSSAYVLINGYGTASCTTPSSSDIKIYPVEIGKTYKVVGKCSTTRPLLVVSDSVVAGGLIAMAGNFDYEYGMSSDATVETAEYTALRTGYLYLTYDTDSCGLWLKKSVITRQYHIDDVMDDIDDIQESIGDMDEAIDQNSDDISDIFEHETYTGEGTTEYDPVEVNTTVSESRTMINGYGTATISTPASSSVKIYPIESGKTYKLAGYCDNTTNRPLLIVADSVVTSSGIATTGNFDYELGTGSSATVEEKEYTALRTGYIYITVSDNTCGLWLKNVPETRKYHIDDVMKDVEEINSSVDLLNDIVFRTKVDFTSAVTKVVPRNAEPVAKVTSLANSITLVRSILSRNVANKNAVNDVEISYDHTIKKGIKTAWLPAGRYYVILGNVGAYTMVKKYENGLYSDTMYKEQFPMQVGITDPGGGYFIIYASSVTNLGDVSGVFVGKLRDGETTIAFGAYSEKTYTPANITADGRIEVVPNGIIEFVNSSNTAVASTVEYMTFGNDDDTTTRKDFVVSPDGSKFLQMIKNDGSVVAARVVPKKAFFIGNSLTSGWQTFGEAASESDKDFVAKFSDVVSDLDSDYTFSRKWATNLEQQTSLANAQSWVANYIDPMLSSDLDLIVVQLSENVVSNAGAVATFPESSLWLLQHLRTECPKARVVWMGVWFDRGWVKTLLENTAKAGCEYVDIRPLYKPENIAAPGDVYKMEADYTKEYTVDSFTVDNGAITITFTLDGRQYTSTIPSYTSYTSSSDTNITVTGIYHVINTHYAYIHPGDEGFRKIANKLLFDLGISDSEETIPPYDD